MLKTFRLFLWKDGRSPATLLGTPWQHQATINNAGGSANQFGMVHIVAMKTPIGRKKVALSSPRIISPGNVFGLFFSCEKLTRKPICASVSA